MPAPNFSREPSASLREAGMDEITMAPSLSPMRLYPQAPASTMNVDPWGSSIASSFASSAMLMPTSRISAGQYQVATGLANHPAYSGVSLDPFASAHFVQLRPDASLMPLAAAMYPQQGNNRALFQVVGAQHPNYFAAYGPSSLRLAQPIQVPTYAPLGTANALTIGPGAPRFGLQNFQLPTTTAYQVLDSAALAPSSSFYPSARPSVSFPRGSDGFPLSLPVRLIMPEDEIKLSDHQVLLRQQIEAFEATEDDATTHTRGRNKPIARGQVGIRCVHCKHISVNRRLKGSTYYPASLLGLYQAAQNMSTTHLQCGLCPEMPMTIKQQFAKLLETKPACSGAGRPYWAKSAERLGLVDTEEGIRFVRNLPPGLKVVGRDDDMKASGSTSG
jgi:hypothetical protein